MSAKGDGGDFDGTIGQPQMKINFEGIASRHVTTNPKPTYAPSPKHDQKHHWDDASPNPIRTFQEGQHLLETGFKLGKQIYNVTEHGEIVKFQPDNGPQAGYHAYGTVEKRDLPTEVLHWAIGDLSQGPNTIGSSRIKERGS